ncbi:SDR family NAD(P)-dependent oxidoreductase [Bosea sp. 2YAB26]|uniref:SDR family NAD(P)-dependent oxidoreductase n=1 Tax=Bosea sp. 2YAB26 TaxID=3237478 RepID=UPI003F8F4B7B
MLLSGKVIVVTGAESGIGRAIAEACAEQGASLIVAGLDKSKLADVAAALGSAGRDALAVATDIREAVAVSRLFSAAVERFGRIDAAVANAGIIGARKPAAELTLEDWQQVLDVNLTGTFLTVLEAARVMVRQGGGGSIIATGSSTALRPVSGLLPYVASKGGVHALMQGLALELAPHRIRVNTLVPGTTATDATRAMPGYLDQVAKSLPMGEVVDVQELGRYVAFALSDQLPHLTGAHLKIDAGRTI